MNTHDEGVRGEGVQGGGRLAGFSSARGWQRYQQTDILVGIREAIKKTHKGS
jgi:hypothetical protein